MNDPVSATVSHLCAVCPNNATVFCAGCDNIKYCSPACEKLDADQHNTLCSTFKDFQERPSPNHFRSIYFPVNEFRTRFIWLCLDGSRGFHQINHAESSQYVPGSQSQSIAVQSHHGISPQREYKNEMIIVCDEAMFVNDRSINECLWRLIGPVAQRWRGGYVGVGFKYHYGADFSQLDAADCGLVEDDFPSVALDLDTTSLVPLVVYLAWYSRRKASEGLFGF